MIRAALPFLSGALFAAGVCLAGMVRPSKVLAFLDFGGAWDGSLALVMASALAVHALAWLVVGRARAPRFGAAYPGPPSRVIDARLVGGAALFGVGWGLAGYCPGPAVVSLTSGAIGGYVFVAAMIAGIYAAPSHAPTSAAQAALTTTRAPARQP
jgi:uncharacterized membrane protein YedE/YeeE